MKEIISKPENQADPEAVKNLFAHLIGGPSEAPTVEALEDEADRAWEDHPILEVVQGPIKGRFRQGDVTYSMGSLPGVAVQIDLETARGPQNIKLGLDGDEPAFDIRAIPAPEDELASEPDADKRRQLIATMPSSWKGYMDLLASETPLGRPFEVEFPAPPELSVEHLGILAEDLAFDREGVNATVGPMANGKDISFGIRLASAASY